MFRRNASAGSNHFVLGDNAEVNYNAAGLVVSYRTTDAVSATGDADSITLGDGNNVVLGRMGSDTITTANGTDTNIGDNGTVTMRADGLQFEQIVSTLPELGGDDLITTFIGQKNLVGGFGKDTITATTGNHIVLGDNAEVNYNAAGLEVSYRTTDAVSATGDADSITLGDGNNVVLGGMGSDTISTANGTDTILGDNGTVTQSAPACRGTASSPPRLSAITSPIPKPTWGWRSCWTCGRRSL